jgi:hypothetical protein
MRDWISAHTQEWPIFVIAAVLLGVLAARAYQKHQPASIPWIFLAVWLPGVTALYIDLGLDRLRGAVPHMWSAQLANIAVMMVLPLLLLLLTLALWRRLRPAALRTGASIATLVGICAMALAPAVSLRMFHLLHAWMMMDRRH